MSENRARGEKRGGSEREYDRLLTEFRAATRASGDCVSYLESLGYSKGQARNAVYRYRQRHGPEGGSRE
jgi:hypothetical protein